MLADPNAPTAPSDHDLVARVRDRDEDALRALMARHGASVLGIATRVLANPALAEEAAQDTFVALWTNPQRFDPRRGDPKAFLMGVARNKAIDMVRREETRRRAAQRFAEEEEPADLSFERLEDREGLLSALRELTYRQRQAVALAYFAGFSYREVARELGIPEGTAKTRLRDALASLRTKLPGLVA